MPALLYRLPNRGDGIRADASPHDGPLQDALKQRERLEDRRLAYAFASELGLERLDYRRRQSPQFVASEPRQHVAVPNRRVYGTCFGGEIWIGICRPPLTGELVEVLFPCLKHLEVAELREPTHFGLERIGIPLAVEVTALQDSGLAPANTPRDLATRMDAPMDAHSASTRDSLASARRPLAAGTRGGFVGEAGDTTSRFCSTHVSTSTGRILNREQSLDAGRSPLSIAR